MYQRDCIVIHSLWFCIFTLFQVEMAAALWNEEQPSSKLVHKLSWSHSSEDQFLLVPPPVLSYSGGGGGGLG